MAKLMVTPDPFVAALLDALGLPKRTRSFELRCAVGEAVTVKCEYYPDADTAAGFDLQPLLAEYQLIEKVGSAPLGSCLVGERGPELFVPNTGDTEPLGTSRVVPATVVVLAVPMLLYAWFSWFSGL